MPNQNPRSYSGWLAYPMIVKEDAPFTRTDMQIFLEERNIQTRVIFTGNILRQPGFQKIDCVGSPDDFVNADNAMRRNFISSTSWIDRGNARTFLQFLSSIFRFLLLIYSFFLFFYLGYLNE